MSTPSEQWISILHISDIHFRVGESGTPLDPHKNARNELVRDVATLCQQHGPINIIAISGDIARAGQTAEYDMAVKWLSTLSKAAGCSLGEVLTVPGNHDVDCSAIHNNPLILGAQSNLRDMAIKQKNEEVRKYLLHTETVETLLRPHHAYNGFAARFECHVKSDRLWWERSFLLNDGSELRIRGMTSTLCSDHKLDNRGNIFLNSSQYEFLRDDGIVYAAICHHSPDWTLMSDDMEDGLRATRLQLFGHKHRSRPYRHADAVRVAAGAVQPDGTSADHLRAYSLIKLRVVSANSGRHLAVDVLPRRWSGQPPWHFEADRTEDGNDTHHFELPLSAWSPPKQLREGRPASVPMANSSKDSHLSHKQHENADAAAAARQLFIRFFALPYSRKWEVCGRLELIREEDSELPDYEKFVVAIRRAIDGGRGEELAHLIAQIESKVRPG